MIIKLEELDEHLFECLTDLGYAPGEDEIEDITDIVVQFFMVKGIMEAEKEDGE